VTRSALRTVHSFNPLVEDQRAGYCVEILDPTGSRFVCSYENATKALGYAMWHGGRVGYCRSDGPVTVYSAFYKATEIAIKVCGRVVTVPRFNGYCRVWEVAIG